MNILKKFFANKMIIIAVVCVLLAAVFLLCLMLGSVKIPFIEAVKAMFGGGEEKHRQIILAVRLPRILGAILCGGALAVSGCLLQTLFSNNMASPSTIGVNVGSGLFTLAVFAAFPSALYLQPIAAFLGALLSALAVFFLGCKTGASKLTIVLSGLAVSAIFSALSDVIISFVDDAALVSSSFKIGGLAGVTMQSLLLPACFVAGGLLLSMLLGYDLNVLSLGEVTARSLGQRVTAVRFLVILASALLAGAAVSVCGLIGFVGLIVPHMTRLMFGSDSRKTIPLNFLVGALLVALCDLVSRVCFAPYELSVGIILALIGAPFFLVLLLKNRRRTGA